MKIGIRERDQAFGQAFGRQRVLWLRLRLRIAVSLLGAINLASSDAGFANVAEPSAMLRVRVNNYTQASPSIVAKAEREAGRILGEAGLRMVWLDCPMEHYGGVHVQQNPCLEPLEATDIVLRVLSERTQNKFQDTVFGFAVVPIFASVYYDYALRSAKRDNDEFEVPVILGCVIAHELGHLLLGSNSHSGSGVMQPQWGRKQVKQALTGGLLFTHEQSKHIQAEVERRTSVQNASLDEQHMRDVRHGTNLSAFRSMIDRGHGCDEFRREMYSERATIIRRASLTAASQSAVVLGCEIPVGARPCEMAAECRQSRSPQSFHNRASFRR
jgi:hypothetical protein